MGPYYLTALVNLLGPASYVTSTCNYNTKKELLALDQKKEKRLK